MAVRLIQRGGLLCAARRVVGLPKFTTQPSFDAASYTAGATVTLSEGIATGDPAPTITVEYFTLDGVDRAGELVGLTWDSTGAPAGTLAAKFRATNSQGFVLSVEITATLQAATLADQTATFGTLTPAGQGGWQPFDSAGQPQPLASVSATGTTRTWSISGGRLVANGTPDVDTGKTMSVTTVGGATLTATIDATTVGEAVATAGELQAVITAGGARLDGKTIMLRCATDYDMSAYSWPAIAPTSPVTFTRERTGVGRPRIIGPWQLQAGTARLRIDGLAIFMAAGGANPITYGEGRGIINGDATGFDDIIVRDCELYSDLRPAADGGYLLELNYGVRIKGDAATAIVIEDNIIHHVGAPLHFQCSNVIARRNLCHDFWVDGAVINSSRADVRNVLIENNHWHSPMGWYEVMHQDFLQIQPAGFVVEDLTIRGNTYAPGAMLTKARPGDNLRLGLISVPVATETLTPTSHANKTVEPSSGATVTLYDPAAAPGTSLWLQSYSSYTISGALHPEVGTSPLTLSSPLALRSDGTQWRAVEPGLRSGVAHLDMDHTVTDLDRYITYMVDTVAAARTITLDPISYVDPQTPQAVKFGLLKPSANPITVVPGSGTTLEVDGAQVASVTISDMQDVREFDLSGTVWTAKTTPMSIQGLPYGNAHSSPTGYARIVAEYNAGFVLSTKGMDLEGDSDITYRYDTVMPILPANGETEMSIPNIALGAAKPDAYGNVIGGVVTGEAGERTNNYERNISQTATVEQARAAMDDMFAVSTFAEFLPTTRAEVVAALTPRAGGPLDGTGQGAIGRYDFAAGAVITPIPAPKYLTLTPANGATGLGQVGQLDIAFDQPVTAGTGNFVLWDVAGNVAAATIAVGSTSITYNRVTVPYSGLAEGKTYEVRWDAGVILGADGQDVAALGAGVHSFTTRSPGFGIKRATAPISTTANNTAFSASYTYGAPTNGALIVVIEGYTNTSPASSVAPTFTGDFAGTPLTGQTYSYATGSRSWIGMAFVTGAAAATGTLSITTSEMQRAITITVFEVGEVNQTTPIALLTDSNLGGNNDAILSGTTTLAGNIILGTVSLAKRGGQPTTIPTVTGADAMELSGKTGDTDFEDLYYAIASEVVATAGAAGMTFNWTGSTRGVAALYELRQ